MRDPFLEDFLDLVGILAHRACAEGRIVVPLPEGGLALDVARHHSPNEGLHKALYRAKTATTALSPTAFEPPSRAGSISIVIGLCLNQLWRYFGYSRFDSDRC